MSEQIKRTDIAEEGVLDNLIKPLSDLKKILSETDQGLKSFAETVEGKLNFGQKAKELREFAAAEKDVNEIYKEKRSVQSETMKADNEIAKLKEKLAALTSQEAKEVANLKAEIAAQNRELQANARATQTQTEAYSRLVKETRDAKNESKELGAQLRELEKTGKSNTEAYEQLANKYQQTTERAAQLDKELKGLDKSVGDNFRNVGNYESALEGVNQKVAEGGMTFRQMSQAIKEYQTIAAQAGRDTPIGRKAIEDAAKLQDYLTSIRTQTTRLADDGANMKAALTLGTTVTQGYQGLLSVQALLGVESEELLAILTKIQATQGVLNSLNAIRNALDKDNILVIKAKTIAQRAYNWVIKGTATGTQQATVATKGLNVVMRAVPIMAVVAGLTALVGWLISTKKETDELTEATKELTEAEKAYNDARSQRLTSQRDIDDLVRISNKLSQEQLKSLKSRLEQEIALSDKGEGEIKLSKERLDLVKESVKANQERLKQIESELESATLLDNVKRQKLLFEKDLIGGKISQELEVIRLQKQGLTLDTDELANLEKRRQQLKQIEGLIRNETKAVKENHKARKMAVTDELQDEQVDRQKALNERLEAQEKALHRESLLRRKANIENHDSQEDFNQAELENEIQLLNDLIELRRDYGEDTLELEIQRNEMLRSFGKEIAEESKETILTTADQISSAIVDIYNTATDNALASLKRLEDGYKRMYGTFEKLAAEGNITAQQSLAEMINRQEEAQRRQMQMERRKLRMQQAQQVSSILLNQLEQGKSPGEALAAAGAFLATSGTLLASLPSFDVGTENTSGGGRGVDGKGGFLAINHPDERIMTAEQNKKVGALSNPMLADIAYKYRTGQLNDNAGNSYDLIELKQELQGIKTAIQNQPQQVVGLEETLSGMVEMMVKNIKGNHTKTTIYKS
jgi:uncharacterized protein (DUF3084 family)